MPPERKVTPGMRGGRQRSSVRTVLCAIVAGSDLAFARPRRGGRTSGVRIALGGLPFTPNTVPTCPELSRRCPCTRVLRGSSFEQSMPSGGLVRALNSGHGHRGLQQRALEQHAVVPKLTVHLAHFKILIPSLASGAAHAAGRRKYRAPRVLKIRGFLAKPVDSAELPVGKRSRRGELGMHFGRSAV